MKICSRYFGLIFFVLAIAACRKENSPTHVNVISYQDSLIGAYYGEVYYGYDTGSSPQTLMPVQIPVRHDTLKVYRSGTNANAIIIWNDSLISQGPNVRYGSVIGAAYADFTSGYDTITYTYNIYSHVNGVYQDSIFVGRKVY